jgi:thiamine-monophosphate kinase
VNEFGIIAKYFAPLSAGFPGSLGLKDDAAVLSPKPGFDLVFTKDALVADVHFFENDDPYTIAQKLLGVNVSDLAAMGAKPVGYLLAVMLPKNTSEKWLEKFTSGFAHGMKKFGGHLIGGDTVSHDGKLSLSLTAIGEVPQGKALKRSGAKMGDSIFVSGTIGDSYLGLQVLLSDMPSLRRAERSESDAAIHLPKDENGFLLRSCSVPLIAMTDKKYLIERYNIPEPHINLGQQLIGIATSCIDISDGLVADLGHICECSGVGAEINIGLIPLSRAALSLDGVCNPVHTFMSEQKYDMNIRKGLQTPSYKTTLKELITGGDDYELLFTVPESLEGAVEKLSKEISVAISKIGKITSGGKVIVLDKNRSEVALPSRGYQHF